MFPFILRIMWPQNTPQAPGIYNRLLLCHYHLALRAQVPRLTWRSMVGSVCALSIKTSGLPGLSVLHGATSCLSDHQAMRPMLRRGKLNNPLTPENPFFSQKTALSPPRIPLNPAFFYFPKLWSPPHAALFIFRVLFSIVLLSILLRSSPPPLTEIIPSNIHTAQTKPCPRAPWHQLLEERTVCF